VVCSRDLSKVTLVESFSLRTNVRFDASGRDPNAHRRGRVALPRRWGVTLGGSTIRRTSGQTVAQTSGRGIIMSRHPVAAFVRSERVALGMGQKTTYHVDLVDIATGGKRSLLVLESGKRDASSTAPSHYATAFRPLYETPEGLALIAGDTVVLVSDEQLGLGTAPIPVHFAARQSRLRATADVPFTLEYEVIGGTAPLSFRLGRALDGVTIDESTGVVTVDPAALMESSQVQSTIGNVTRQLLRQRPRDQESIPEEPDWSALSGPSDDRLRPILGAPIEGLPTPLRITVIARDANHHEAELTHELVLEIPRETFLAAYTAERERVMAREAERKMAETARGAERRSIEELAAENERLRAEVEKLKAQVELLTKLLKEERDK
jgi:IS5 family transposase